MSWFLHQTTTIYQKMIPMMCCICLDSYIKPQHGFRQRRYLYCCICLDSYIKPQPLMCLLCQYLVVYVLIPTSNHNHTMTISLVISLYMSWFLHQTTTFNVCGQCPTGCICLDSYIKPQHVIKLLLIRLSCICLDSYIKPQLTKHLYPRQASCICLDSYIKPQPCYDS